MPSTTHDFLIIGQGLAGSLLAFELIQRGQRVLVLDDDHHASSTQIAAGIINPITGHRLNITEDFKQFISVATPFYKHLENKLSIKVLKPTPQTRLIKNPGQARYFNERLRQPQYRTLLFRSESTCFRHNPYGCAEVGQTAIVDTRSLLVAVRKWLQNQNSLHIERVKYASLEFHPTGIRYGPTQAKKIVFCEGHQAIHNPWLKDLPFKLAKGEILTIKTAQPASKMLNWGHWLVPAADGLSKLGSNFVWNDLQLTTDTATARQLLDSLNKNTQYSGQLVHHDVGIRPTTLQRKPFLGSVPLLNSAYCFNGLGSKGCLIAPFYTQLLAQHLLAGDPLPPEVTAWC